mmetsp:Transcript_43849/g.50443  ORF Transcript_43849/g.50443 Transcript_43849/m.50443 type:complete len:164 (+) Transcript_43849:2-493(+)
MEVSGIEGNFRNTCENVMRVMRDNKDSLIAILEAFVYDPLINWRLLKNPSPSRNIPTSTKAVERSGTLIETNLDVDDMKHTPERRFKEDEFLQHLTLKREEDRTEILNANAVKVLERIKHKLTGKDFNNTEPLTHIKQVDKLIKQATSEENLCQSYIGWCPYW